MPSTPRAKKIPRCTSWQKGGPVTGRGVYSSKAHGSWRWPIHPLKEKSRVQAQHERCLSVFGPWPPIHPRLHKERQTAQCLRVGCIRKSTSNSGPPISQRWLNLNTEKETGMMPGQQKGASTAFVHEQGSQNKRTGCCYCGQWFHRKPCWQAELHAQVMGTWVSYHGSVQVETEGPPSVVEQGILLSSLKC